MSPQQLYNHHGKARTMSTAHPPRCSRPTNSTNRTFHCTFRTFSVMAVGLSTRTQCNKDLDSTFNWVTLVITFTTAHKSQILTRSIIRISMLSLIKHLLLDSPYLYARITLWMWLRIGRHWWKFTTRMKRFIMKTHRYMTTPLWLLR